MISEIPVSASHLYAFSASGKLTDADYRNFLPRLEEILEKEKPVSLLIRLEDFKGWEAKAAWDDLKFGMQHQEDFERIAIVGESTLERWMTALGAAFVDAELKYFDQKRQQEAWEWLMQSKNRVERDEYAGYRNILVPVDFSAHTDRIVRRAMEAAQQGDARVTLLHVVDDILMPGEFYDIAVDLELEKKQHEVAHSRMEKLSGSIEYPMLASDVLSGNPGATILSYADKHDIDLIVIGSHGKRGVERILGSVVNRVMQHTVCDLLMVRL
ncbi:MAG: universal stress protein [Gammaproteobacteria bacterium]|jgi:nucleotide-binding universal stress UspA family protein